MANLRGLSGPTQLYIWSVVAAALFSGLWFVMANIWPPWSDETAHMSAAMGILLTGKPFIVDFEQCASLTSVQYLRQIEISHLTAWSYRLFGESIRSARVVPFVFTIATWLLYVVYTQWRGYSSAKQILIASLLFFGQSLVLEKSVYARAYAPLVFFLLLALIATWEAVNSWRAGKIPATAAWVVVVVLSMGITRWWHFIHHAVFALAIILLWLSINRLPIRTLLRQGWQKVVSLSGRWRYPSFALLVLLAIATITIGPRAVDLIGTEFLGFRSSFEFGRRYHSFITFIPWDNIAGLIRFLLVTNVLLILWWRTSKSEGSGRDFDSWILTTGIISGLLIAFFMNHSFVFYGRFFLFSVGLIILGASKPLAELPTRYSLGAVLGVYLIMNVLMSGMTLYFDRSNVGEALDWLETNASENDLILGNGVELYLNGGEGLCGRVTKVTRPPPAAASVDDLTDVPVNPDRTDYFRPYGKLAPWMSADTLKGVLDNDSSLDVYFVYSHFYEFRNDLYRWTTGRERNIRSDMYGLLRDGDVGPEIDLGLRGAGLRRIDRKKLLDAIAARSQ